MMQRTKVRQRLASLLRSRIFITLLLAFLAVSLGGAAFGLKKSYDPGKVQAAHRHDQPIEGYSSHADFEKECKHCHAPVRCLSANLCQDCHRQIARERADSEGLHGMLPGTNKCQTCHKEHQGRGDAVCDVPFGAINHEGLSGFGLDLHQTGFDGTPLTCESCHPDGKYDDASVSCVGCHAADNPEQMARHVEQYGDSCARCHDGRDRMIAGFEHDEFYVLEGAHQGAGCQDCHADTASGDTARGCADCHEASAVHAGETGLHCDWCHTAIAWSPAHLTEHIFRLDHGGLDEVSCETCHSGAYVAHTCYGCHDHQPAEMQELHAQEGIDQLEPCGECHPTGLEGEAVRGGNIAGEASDGS